MDTGGKVILATKWPRIWLNRVLACVLGKVDLLSDNIGCQHLFQKELQLKEQPVSIETLSRRWGTNHFKMAQKWNRTQRSGKFSAGPYQREWMGKLVGERTREQVTRWPTAVSTEAKTLVQDGGSLTMKATEMSPKLLLPQGGSGSPAKQGRGESTGWHLLIAPTAAPASTGLESRAQHQRALSPALRSSGISPIGFEAWLRTSYLHSFFLVPFGMGRSNLLCPTTLFCKHSVWSPRFTAREEGASG